MLPSRCKACIFLLSPIKSIHMGYDCFYSIYDQDGRYVGFTDTLEDAVLMINDYNGHYELEFASSDSVFG